MAKKSDTPPVLDKFGLPPRDIQGKANPAYYRAAYAKLNELLFSSVIEGGKVPFNYDAALIGIDKEAKASGFDPKLLKDQRSTEQRIVDALERLCEAPREVWEQIDDEADALITMMDKADKGAFEYIGEKARASGIPKLVRSVLAKVRTLRQRARQTLCPAMVATAMATLPISPAPKGLDDWQARAALEAAWPLRLMLYCGRSNLPHLANGSPEESVYCIASHHIKIACDVWQARKNIRYGKPRDGLSSLCRANWGESEYQGCIVVCAPAHGKTEIGRFIVDSMLVENPTHQLMMTHSVGDKAIENMAYLASLYQRTSEVGRRHGSLYPHLQLDQCSSKKFRIKLTNQNKSPTAVAAGVSSRVNGSNASILWGDDIVDQSEAVQESERKQTFDVFNGTWLPRLRVGGFLFITATLWHKADTISRLIDGAHKSGFRVSIQRCGGPKTSPQFSAIWPEMYPSKRLRQIYETMRNPGLYSAAYMANPVAEEKRIVRKLRLYDPSTDEHARFLSSSAKYLSLDPAATRGERSDHAGAVYAGFGTVSVEKTVNDRKLSATEHRVRILAADSIPSTQAELVAHTVELTKTRIIDYVMVECRSGYVGTAEMFENYHGVDVIRLDPRSKGKEERLRAAAPAMEDANADLGVRAVVEIPGIWKDDGTMGIDPRFTQLAEEILDFGVCATDNLVDALTQMVIYLSPDLGIGTGGIVNRMVAKHEGRAGPSLWITQQLELAEKGPPKLHGEDDIAAWTRTNWNMPPLELPS